MERLRHGRVLNVYDETLGAALDGVHFAGVTMLTLTDEPWDFDEDGGTLTIDDVDRFDYTAVDDDANTITLDSETLKDYDDQTVVRVWPLAHVRWAEVLWEDEEDEETGVVRIPHSLKLLMPTGRRRSAKHQESVVIEHDSDGWVIKDILGRRPRLSRDHSSNLRTLRYTAEGVAADGYKGIRQRGYAGNAYRVKVVVGVAPTSAATFDVLLAGVSQATLVIPAGRTHVATNIDVDFDEHQAWRLEMTDPADAGADIKLYVFVTLDEDMELE